MKARLTSLVLLVTLVSAFALAPLSAAAFVVKKDLKNIPVTGTLEDGGTFDGKLTITGLSFDDGGLKVTGVLKGEAIESDGTVTEIKQTFTAPATLTDAATTSPVSVLQQVQQACDILFLDIGPIFLDLLGLVVDLSQIILDIDAVPGAGNLLGNLLCALVGLLDGFALGDLLLGILSQILQSILDAINQLLG